MPQGYKGYLPTQAIERSRTILILSAASFRQPAFESTELQSDVYTHFFLRCLRSLATPKQQAVMASQIHACAVGRTFRYVRKKFGQFQLPGLESRIDGMDVIYLTGAHTPTPSVSVPTPQATVQIFHQVLDRWQVRFYRNDQKGGGAAVEQQGEMLLMLDPGAYRVRLISRTDQSYQEYNVQIKAGERLILPSPVSPFSLELDGGLLGSSIATVSFYGGASCALYWRWLGLRLGYWGGQGVYTTTSYQQHLLTFRLEAGWRPSWGMFHLLLGGYVGTGVLLQQHQDGLHSGPLGQYGLLLVPALRIAHYLQITLPIEAGFTLLPLGGQLKHLAGGSVRLGLRYHF